MNEVIDDKVAALMEEFDNQIRIAPRLADERAGRPAGRTEARGESPLSYGGLRAVPEMRIGSRRAR